MTILELKEMEEEFEQEDENYIRLRKDNIRDWWRFAIDSTVKNIRSNKDGVSHFIIPLADLNKYSNDVESLLTIVLKGGIEKLNSTQ